MPESDGDNVSELAAKVRSLINIQVGQSFTFEEIEYRVEDEFNEPEDGAASDRPDHACMDEAVSEEAVKP